MKTYTEDELLKIRDRHEGWLMEQPGVTGTGIGLGSSGQIVLRIYTHGIAEPTRQAITNKLAGLPVSWEEGEVVAY